MTVNICRIFLKNYRNFKTLDLEFNKNIILIIGQNGAGKTNILEAISLLSPGKGLRNTSYREISGKEGSNWFSSVVLQSKLGKAEVNFNYQDDKNSRTIDYNGSSMRQQELVKLVNIIWLTTQMDNIFLESAADKRRFFDRIVYNFYPEHARHVTTYEHLTSQRLKALTNKDAKPDELWLDVLEEKIAIVAINISDLRTKAFSFLQSIIAELELDFPKSIITVKPLVGDNVASEDMVTVYKENLKAHRVKDSITKRTNFSVNRQEIIVMHSLKQRTAEACSTGEQKALLISIILGQIEAIKRITRYPPILLLDELFVHLDDERKQLLLDIVRKTDSQVFITATDLSGFEAVIEASEIIEL